MHTLFRQNQPRVTLISRDYQRKADNESFRLWDDDILGVLARIFTGGGKTALACMWMRKWLERGDDYRAMVISYERDLVWQFAQEIEDFLGIVPGIEMGDEHVPTEHAPRAIVASRASLLPAQSATPEQLMHFARYGIQDVGWTPQRLAKRILRHLDAGGHMEEAYDELERIKKHCPEAAGDTWSRLHKFDWRLNWLLIFDEAHRHVHSLKSVGHIVDWFGQNPAARRGGLTATPKRGDGVSLGHKMFPGVSIDYPLYHITKPCAVKQGWAVPYVQKYIEVEGVDFKSIKKVAGDFDDADLERVLGEEGCLAKMVEPLLDMVGERRTLIFSPGVEMAKNVARYINARAQVECPACNARQWHPVKLLGDGALCKCGYSLSAENATKVGEQARSMNGKTNPNDRKQTYLAHQSGRFQFLSVCGLCREGYNDPDISCVAIFRPVSKKASSLAEQMKGRGCRPCRAIIPVLNQLLTPEERVDAINESNKPNCLIVDLVGVTGLADCASTVQIYAEGLDDEVIDLAGELLENAAEDEETDVAEIIDEAQKQVEAAREAEKERIRAEQEADEQKQREKAANRAKAGASVTYSEHDVGVGSSTNPNRASENQYKYIAYYGLVVKGDISGRQASRIIDQLKRRTPFAVIAHTNRLSAEQWEVRPPTENQMRRLRSLDYPMQSIESFYDASQVMGAALNPIEFEEKKTGEINGVADGEILTALAKDVQLARRVLAPDVYDRLKTLGKTKRAALMGDDE